jgi:hypothetical protein
MINGQIDYLFEQLQEQLKSIRFGNVDFVIHNGVIIRVDIKKSIKPER